MESTEVTECDACGAQKPVLKSTHPKFKGTVFICSQVCSDLFWTEKLVESQLLIEGNVHRGPLRLASVGRCSRKNTHEDATACGEDAYFISDSNLLVGVADGVGGFGGTSSYISSCMMSQMMHTSHELEKELKAKDHKRFDRNRLRALLDSAQKNCTEAKLPEGATTAVVGVIDPEDMMLHVLNVGDSGLVVIRRGRIVLQTRPQVHSDGGAPYQMSNIPGEADTAADGELYSFGPLQRGDLVLLGSDGVWDNIMDTELTKMVRETRISGIYSRAEADLGRLADKLVKFCRKIKRKPDDTTVVLLRVYAPEIQR